MSTAKNRYSATGKDKSTFAMTCNRLSSFLKENGTRINATFDVKGTHQCKISPDFVTGKPETPSPAATVDLVSKIGSPTTEKTAKSVNYLPQHVTVDSFCKPDDSSAKSVSGKAEVKTAQMTIFYRGEILVFDCVSADKARDMMLAATGASSSNSNQIRNQIQLVNGLDLPIARRASLHKFMEKRRDRASERGPYQLQNRLMAVSSRNYEFDLNL